MKASFLRIAHRGSSGAYPENTRIAIEKALAAGVDVVELDCQLSKDGHVVVFHDDTLRRTARANGAVRSKALKQLKQLDVGSWKKKSLKNERILTLEEAMELVVGKAALNVELKTFAKGPLGIELKTLFVLSHYKYLKRTIVSSFDYRSLRRVREFAPEATLGVLYGKGSRENPFQAARELGAYSIHMQKEMASPGAIEKAREAGLKSFIWTVNDLREMERFLALGVDGLISDYPEKFWKIRLKRK